MATCQVSKLKTLQSHSISNVIPWMRCQMLCKQYPLFVFLCNVLVIVSLFDGIYHRVSHGAGDHNVGAHSYQHELYDIKGPRNKWWYMFQILLISLNMWFILWSCMHCISTKNHLLTLSHLASMTTWKSIVYALKKHMHVL